MSTPSWNENVPEPAARSLSERRNTVRGSPKLPRTGCGESNGFNGHSYPARPGSDRRQPCNSARTLLDPLEQEARKQLTSTSARAGRRKEGGRVGRKQAAG